MMPIDRNTWYIVAAMLGVGLLGGLVWFARQASLRRAPVPGAFLIAILFHLLLGGGMFCVAIGGGVEKVVQKLQGIIPVLPDYATSTKFEAHEGYRAAPQPFELVKELAVKDSVAAASITQQPLETPEMRVSAESVKTALPVPQDDSPGKRADETPEVPVTPESKSPARTNIPVVETPAAPDAPIEEIPLAGQVSKSEPRAAAEEVQLARAPALVDPLASAKVSRSAVPTGPAERVLPADMRDDRTVAAPPSASVKGANVVPRAARPEIAAETVAAETIRATPAPAGAPGKNAVAINVGRQTSWVPGPEVGTAGRGVNSESSLPAVSPAGKISERADLLPSFKPGDGVLKRRVQDPSGAYAEGDIGPKPLLGQRPDKDLIADGQMKGQRILMVAFYRDDEIESSPLTRALTAKGFAIERISHPLPQLADFEALLDKSQQFWLWSSVEANRFPKGHLQAVVKRWKNGKLAICLLADNTPYTTEAAAVLAAVSPGSTIRGSYLGMETLRARSSGGSGFDSESPLFHNLNTLYEGATISTMSGPGLVPVCYASDGSPLIATLEQVGSSRLVVHGGFTSFFRRFWNDAGVSRFAVNSAGWLSNVETKVEDATLQK